MRLVDIRGGEIIVSVKEWEAPHLADLARLAEMGTFEGGTTEFKSHLDSTENAMLADALCMFWEVAGLLAELMSHKRPLSEERVTRARALINRSTRAAANWEKVAQALQGVPSGNEEGQP